MTIPPQIPRRWFFYSAALIGGLALIILWLPTNYGMGLFDTMTSVFNLIANFVIDFYFLILFLFRALLNLLYRPSNQLIPGTIIPPQEQGARF